MVHIIENPYYYCISSDTKRNVSAALLSCKKVDGDLHSHAPSIIKVVQMTCVYCKSLCDF